MNSKSRQKPAYPAFIGKDRELLRLVAKVAELNRLIDAVRVALPHELASACLNATLDTSRPAGNELLIGVNSSAAAARVRLAGPALIAKLAAVGWQVSVITPKVQVALQLEKSSKTKDLHLSGGAMAALEGLAQSVEDPGIAEALRTLLSHHRD
ncbi:DciA family protein [Andreprevotia sp. IGB-42]|uniref:DciA family protein n=1 Tax=Andreprevotia sp. IGB-42 TaxID=2497473 RepID=UPI00135CA611|nr:DciA family protein [Andreprevotia sp. IGB-42]